MFEHQTPYDLYTASGLTDSHVAKFILAMNAIEQMSDKDERKPQAAQEILDSWGKSLEDSSVPKGIRKDLKNVIGMTRLISIRKAGQKLVKDLLGDDEEIALYEKLSTYRGKVAHLKEIKSIEDVSEYAANAHSLAGRLLAKKIGLR